MLCEKVKKSVTLRSCIFGVCANIKIESPTVAQIQVRSPTTLCEGLEKQVRSSIGIVSGTSQNVLRRLAHTLFRYR